MPGTTLSRVGRRMIDRHGQTVTLRNYENVGDTEYGATWELTSDSPKDVQAIPDRTSKGLGADRDPRSTETKAARLYHVKDSVTGIRDGGGDGASELVDDGVTWIVMHQDVLENGQYRLLCWREE